MRARRARNFARQPANLALIAVALLGCRAESTQARAVPDAAPRTRPTLAIPIDASRGAAATNHLAPPAASVLTERAPPPAGAKAENATASAQDAGFRTALPSWIRGAKTVLHVGDSTVGYRRGLALYLGRTFQQAGLKYESRTLTSVGLKSFDRSKVLDELLRELDPELVVISLGTNNFTAPNPDFYETNVRSIVARIMPRRCVWIGPISLDKPQHGVVKMIRRASAPCAFFDSTSLELERQPDGVHPTDRAAKRWTEAIWQMLASWNPPEGPPPTSTPAFPEGQ